MSRDLQITGRSTTRAKKTNGANFAKQPKQNRVSRTKQSESVRSSCTLLDFPLSSPSSSDKTGNPLLTTEDVLERLSKSLPPSQDPEEDFNIPERDNYIMKIVNQNKSLDISVEELAIKRTFSKNTEQETVMKPCFSKQQPAAAVEILAHSDGSPRNIPTQADGRKSMGGKLFVERLDNAALKIQKQWKIHKACKEDKLKPKEHEDFSGLNLNEEIQRMLRNEKEKMLAERAAEQDKKKQKEEKKRQSRLQAIEELNKKREEKRLQQQKLIEDELKAATEQVTKMKKKKLKPCSKPATPRLVETPKPSTSLYAAPNKAASSEEKAVMQKECNRTESYDDLIDEIFSSTRQTNEGSYSSDVDTPRQVWQATDSPKANPTTNTADPPTNRADKKAFSSLMETLMMLEKESDIALSDAKSSSVIIPPTPKLTQGEVYRLDSMGAGELRSSGVMSNGKIKSLLDFLDNADHSIPTTQQQLDTQRTERSYPGSVTERARLASATVDEVTESVRETHSQLEQKQKQLHVLKTELCSTSSKTAELQAQVYAARLDVDEKSKAILMLQRALDEQRDLTLRLTSEQEKDTRQRLQNQKNEYETTVKRHLGFIDQLIADKKELSEKVEKLVHTLKSTEKTLGDRVKHLESNKDFEMKKQKEAIEIAERIKREEWIKQKSNHIKEMTVRGLEPEIQKLISKNKSEMKKVKAMHEAELLEADERASKRFVAQVEELREQYNKEKEASCSRERDNAKVRYEKQLEQEEQAYQQQRRRLYAEVQEEKERVAQSLAKQKNELETERSQHSEETSVTLAKCNAQHRMELEKVQYTHDNELRDLKLRLEVEKEQWQATVKQKQDAELLNREREIKSVLRGERDKEIELVISKLEEESAVQREDVEAGLESRMRRMRDKYESQITDLEHLHGTSQGKLNAMKERVTDLEADNIRLRGGIKNVERENEEIEKVSSRLKSERDKVEDVIRTEFSERLVKLEEEAKNDRASLVEAKTRHRLELERVERTHTSEMEEVQGRIKTAFNKRDEVIKELNEKSQQASSRADHLEALLIKQREQLLKPK